jgi:hypothetical protein
MNGNLKKKGRHQQLLYCPTARDLKTDRQDKEQGGRCPLWADTAAEAVNGNFYFFKRTILMNTSKTLAALLIFASVTTVALAKGPGNGSGTCATPGTCAASGEAAGSADAAGAGAGSMKRSQTRDPATNPSGTPLQTRTHTQTPVAAPVVAPAVDLAAPTVIPSN